MMLDFICELEKALTKWPETATWTLAQIADQTFTGVPQVVDYLTDTLDRELEVHETLTRAEAVRALDILTERMSAQLAARQKHLDDLRDRAIRAYDGVMEKIRVLQATKNWRSAYKTLSYYVGCYEKDLPKDLMIELSGECLRLGIKSDANLQELSLWLRKGIDACISIGTLDALENGLDFLDAYAPRFIDDNDGRGKRLLGHALETLCQASDLLQNNPQYTNLIKELGY